MEESIIIQRNSIKKYSNLLLETKNLGKVSFNT
jgi:hypothetical protein